MPRSKQAMNESKLISGPRAMVTESLFRLFSRSWLLVLLGHRL